MNQERVPGDMCMNMDMEKESHPSEMASGSHPTIVKKVDGNVIPMSYDTYTYCMGSQEEEVYRHASTASDTDRQRILQHTFDTAM